MIYIGLLLLILLLTHYLISYWICRYFLKSYKQALNKLGIFTVMAVSGPVTLLFILVIIFITPLKNTDAGLFDGGLALMILLSLFVFPLVNALLIRILFLGGLMLKK